MTKKENTAPQVVKTDEEWQAQLTPDQYYIARQHGTEPSFSGPYWDEKAPGTYECICCGAKLFDAETKYDSGTGWPSFFKPMQEESIAEHADNSLFRRRTEVRCSNCDAHLGHVFPDGPKPTGLRYCINGTVLKHIPKK